MVHCSVTDPDDSNSPATTTFTVTVKGAAAQLVDLGHSVNGVGPGTSLSDKVTQAQNDLKAGDTTDACGVLGAFINQVKAQAGQLGKTTAATLIADAQQIRAVLGC
jgi:hypothetical protein